MSEMLVEVMCVQCKGPYLVPYSQAAMLKLGEQFGECVPCRKPPETLSDQDSWYDQDYD